MKTKIEFDGIKLRNKSKSGNSIYKLVPFLVEENIEFYFKIGILGDSILYVNISDTELIKILNSSNINVESFIYEDGKSFLYKSEKEYHNDMSKLSEKWEANAIDDETMKEWIDKDYHFLPENWKMMLVTCESFYGFKSLYLNMLLIYTINLND